MHTSLAKIIQYLVQKIHMISHYDQVFLGPGLAFTGLNQWNRELLDFNWTLKNNNIRQISCLASINQIGTLKDGCHGAFLPTVMKFQRGSLSLPPSSVLCLSPSSVSLSLSRLCLCLSLPLPLSVYLSLSLCLCLSVCLSVFLSGFCCWFNL